jgi:hypothetical protein
MILPRSGKDRLEFLQPSPFGASAGRITLDQVQLAASRSVLMQSRSLPGSPPMLSADLRRTSSRALRAASRASAACSPFAENDLGTLGILLEITSSGNHRRPS